MEDLRKVCPKGAHPYHRVFDKYGQFLSLSLVQTLHPMTFAYSLSSEAVVMRQLRR